MLGESGKSRLKRDLAKHEGIKKTVYQCSMGKMTIGVGRNLEDNGLSNEEIEFMLMNDIDRIEKEVRHVIPNIDEHSETRQIVLMNMAFNMGTVGLLRFKQTLKAFNNKDYPKAAEEMLDSRWARQVGKRAEELSDMMEAG